MNRTKVLVTGCAGFLGSSLTGKLLQKGYHVIGVDRLRFNQTYVLNGLLQWSQPPYEDEGVLEFHKTDIRDTHKMRKLVARADVIVHMAALVGQNICDQYRSEAWEVNDEATKNLVNMKHDSQRLLYFCSNSGYGTGTTPKPVFTEHEKSVLQHPNTTSFRLSTVYGLSARQRFDLLVNYVTAKLVHDEKISVYQPGYYRNFVNIDDVGDLAYNWINQGYNFSRSVYNVGDDRLNMTKGDMIRLIASFLDVPEAHITEAEGEDPDQRNYIVSNERLCSLGWSPQYNLLDVLPSIRQYAELYGPKVLELGEFA
jgi:nucleoside-diphosphate-sugar epimerase